MATWSRLDGAPEGHFVIVDVIDINTYIYSVKEFHAGQTAMTKVDCVLKLREGGGPKAECPLWDWRVGKLYWCDIDGGTLNRFDPSTGRNETRTIGEQIGSFALTAARDTFLIATRSGLHFFEFDSGTKRPTVNPEPDRPANRLNDGRCDAAGRFWVGSMRDPIEAPDRFGTLYRVTPDLVCTGMLDGLGIPNGIVFSPDGKTMYLSDTNTQVRTIWKFDYDLQQGRLANRRVFAETGDRGRPDGACCDVDGGYWSALLDGWHVARYTPDGKLDRTIRLPVQWPSMCAFGGPDLDILYITTLRRGGPQAELPDQPLAGALFACRPGVQGVRETPFAG